LVNKEIKHNILLLKFYDITEMNAVDNEEIENKDPAIVEYIGFLHSETKDIYCLSNFCNLDTSDILMIPKSLIISKKKIEV